MPYAVTHILLTIIVVALFRDFFIKRYHPKYLTLHTLVIAGVGGLLPDIDVPLNWLLNSLGYSFEILKHGGVTHTPFFALLFLIPGLILWKKEKHQTAIYFFVLAFGVFFHLLLDYLLGGGDHYGIMWLWPLTAARFKVHLLARIGLSNIPIAIDALILLGWLWYEEATHKIRDFI